MNKVLGLLVAATAALGVSTTATTAQAAMSPEVLNQVQQLQTQVMVQSNLAGGLNWHVGDKASYSLDIGGFIKGTSNNSVTQDTGTHFWFIQDMDLSIQKQKVEAMINKSNGQIDKLLVNGAEQSVPKVDQEIVEMKESHIKVAAGEFDCIYAKIKDKSNGNITEAWINPQVVPMSGMLKAMADSQFGKVNQEATSFAFAVPPAPAPTPAPSPVPTPVN